MFWIRVKRFLAALANLGFPLLAIIIAALGLISSQRQPNGGVEGFWYVIVFAGIVWLMQSFFDYRRKTHDPTWAIHYTDKWEAVQTLALRSKAAWLLRTYASSMDEVKANIDKLADVDEALDVLEEIAFYVLGEQISPEVAHHHFYHWVRGYWCSARDYIKECKDNEKALFDHIEPLYDLTTSIEAEKEKCAPAALLMSRDEVVEFLDWEIKLSPGHMSAED